MIKQFRKSIELYYEQELEGFGYSCSDYTPGAWKRIFFFLLKEGFEDWQAREIMLSKHTRWCRDRARDSDKKSHQLSTFPDWVKYYGEDGKKFFKQFLKENL